MIVSHRHKFIYFAVPKTATHAIRDALRPHLGPDDWEQQVLFGSQSSPIAEIAAIRHGHITANEIRAHLDPDVWDNYFKFGFVRNPFDRFVSVCFFLNRSDPEFAASAIEFMKQRLPRARFQQRVLVRPQHQQLCINDEMAVDFVGRYEELQQSFDIICERIGIPNTELGIRNTSRHDRFTDYYKDDKLRQLVSDFYAQDFRLFSYDSRNVL